MTKLYEPSNVGSVDQCVQFELYVWQLIELRNRLNWVWFRTYKRTFFFVGPSSSLFNSFRLSFWSDGTADIQSTLMSGLVIGIACSSIKQQKKYRSLKIKICNFWKAKHIDQLYPSSAVVQVANHMLEPWTSHVVKPMNLVGFLL